MKYLADLPDMDLMALSISVRNTMTNNVSHTLSFSMEKKTATIMEVEEIRLGMDWVIICRSVSVSLV